MPIQDIGQQKYTPYPQDYIIQFVLRLQTYSLCMKIREFLKNNYALVALTSVLIIFLLVVTIAYAQKDSITATQPYGREHSSMNMHDQNGNGGMRQNNRGLSEHQVVPAPTSTELSQQAKDAIYKALDDEYKAYSTYQSITNKLGNVRPFTNIMKAEQKHINSLVTLLNNYNLDVPTTPYANIEVADTLADNCSAGVQAEIANASLYKEQLLPAVTAYTDITAVFNNLMNASQQKHLPAFSRCAD